MHAALLAFPLLNQLPGTWEHEMALPPPAGQTQGYSLIQGPDLDSDGHPDLISTTFEGWQVVSAASRSFLRQHDNPALITPSLTPDQDGDGHQDVLFATAGGTNPTKVLLLSSDSGQLLKQYTVQERANQPIAIGDINGDAVLDFALARQSGTYQGQDSVGTIRILSGASGAVLHQASSPIMRDGFADTLKAIGDLNGDGIPELITGANRATSAGKELSGALLVYSGADLSLNYVIYGQWKGQALGSYIYPIEDVDGDGFQDIATPYYLRNKPTLKVGVLSGRDGSLLYEIVPENFGHNGFGSNFIQSMDDLDGDGTPDLLISKHLGGDGFNTQVRFYSGVDGNVIGVYRPDNEIAHRAVSLGDTDSDGQQELCLLQHQQFSSGGALHFSSFHPTIWMEQSSLSSSTGGRIDMEVDFPSRFAGHPYRILGSALGQGPTEYGVSIPLSVDPLFHRMLELDSQPLSTGFAGLLDSAGAATAQVLVPPGLLSPWDGNTFYFAAVVTDLTGLPILSSTPSSLEIQP